MGRVLPRENSWVEAVPCRILTQSTGSRWGWIGGLCLFDVCSASLNTVLTAARPDVLRNVRLLGPFALSFDMLSRDAFSEKNLYQDRLIVECVSTSFPDSVQQALRDSIMFHDLPRTSVLG
jgi:hypothetical protein